MMKKWLGLHQDPQQEAGGAHAPDNVAHSPRSNYDPMSGSDLDTDRSDPAYRLSVQDRMRARSRSGSPRNTPRQNYAEGTSPPNVELPPLPTSDFHLKGHSPVVPQIRVPQQRFRKSSLLPQSRPSPRKLPPPPPQNPPISPTSKWKKVRNAIRFTSILQTSISEDRHLVEKVAAEVFLGPSVDRPVFRRTGTLSKRFLEAMGQKRQDSFRRPLLGMLASVLGTAGILFVDLKDMLDDTDSLISFGSAVGGALLALIIIGFIVTCSKFSSSGHRKAAIIVFYLLFVAFIVAAESITEKFGLGDSAIFFLVAFCYAFSNLQFKEGTITVVVMTVLYAVSAVPFLFIGEEWHDKYDPQRRLRQSALLGVYVAFFSVPKYHIEGAQLRAFQIGEEYKEEEERTREQAVLTEVLLLNVLPREIVPRLRDQATIADDFDNASVLFADIVGFTELSSKITAFELVTIFNELFSRFDDLSDEFGVEKIKTIGDCYMVASGLPVKRSDHTHALCDMALEMLKTLKKFNQDMGTNLNVRIGINSGPVVAGVIGKSKYTYDLWGDTVNTASRMESHGIPGRIQISESTFRSICQDFITESRGPIKVKGKGMLNTFFLTGRKGAVAVPPTQMPGRRGVSSRWAQGDASSPHQLLGTAASATANGSDSSIPRGDVSGSSPRTQVTRRDDRQSVREMNDAKEMQEKAEMDKRWKALGFLNPLRALCMKAGEAREMEVEFRRWLSSEYLKEIRHFWVGIAACLALSFALDDVYLRDRLGDDGEDRLVWSSRLRNYAMIPLSVLYTVSTFSKTFISQFIPITIVISLLISGTLVALSVLTSREYSYAVLFSAIFIDLFSRLPFAIATLINVFLLGGYYVVVFMTIEENWLDRAGEGQLNHEWLLSISLEKFLPLVMVGLASRFTLERSERVLFMRQKGIEKRQKDRLADHARAEELLTNSLPSSLFHSLKAGKKPIVDGFGTILFADIVGFTEMSSKMTPRALVDRLNKLFQIFDDLAEHRGVEKIKTIGDCYMAAAGVPTPTLDHAAAMLEFAMDMISAIQDFNHNEGSNINLRVGINSGPVVGGVIGRSKFIFDLWGDTVNVASRMESHGVPGRIHLSESSWLRLRKIPTYRFAERGEISVKGKGKMRTFLLEGVNRE